MSLCVTFTPPELTLSLSGDIDHHSARALMLSIDRELLNKLPRRLTLDLSSVSFMDSSGIALLLRAWRRSEELGASILVRAVPPQPLRVLSAAGLDKLIPIAP